MMSEENIYRDIYINVLLIIFMSHKKWHSLSPSKRRRKRKNVKRHRVNINQMSESKCECFFMLAAAARSSLGENLKWNWENLPFETGFTRPSRSTEKIDFHLINFEWKFFRFLLCFLFSSENFFSSVHIPFLLNHVHWFRKHIIK